MSTFSEAAEMAVIRGESQTSYNLDYGGPVDAATRMDYISKDIYEFDTMPSTPATSMAFNTPVARSQFSALRLPSSTRGLLFKPLAFDEHAVPSTPASPLPTNLRLSHSTSTPKLATGSSLTHTPSSRYHPYHPRLPNQAEPCPETIRRHQSPSWSSSYEPYSNSNNESPPSQSNDLDQSTLPNHSQVEHRRIQIATFPASPDPFLPATPTRPSLDTSRELQSSFPSRDSSLAASASSWFEDQDLLPARPGAATPHDQDSPPLIPSEQHRTWRAPTHRMPIGKILVVTGNDLHFSYLPGEGSHLIIEAPPPCQVCGHPPRLISPSHRQNYFASNLHTPPQSTRPAFAMADEEPPAHLTRSKAHPNLTQPATQKKTQGLAPAKSKQVSTVSAPAKAPAKRAAQPSAPQNSRGKAPLPASAKRPSTNNRKQDVAQRKPANSQDVLEGGNVVMANETGATTDQLPKKKASGPPKGANSRKQNVALRNPANSQDGLEDSDVVMAEEPGANTDQPPKKKTQLPASGLPKRPGANNRKQDVAQRKPVNSQDGDVVMASEPSAKADQPGKKKGTQPGTATTLKRKSSARSLLETASVAEDAPSPATEAPRPKKSKSSSTLGKQANTNARNNTNSAATTPASRSAALPILDNAPPAKSSKKGPAQPKNAVVAAQKVLLEKENESLKALLAAEKAENERLRYTNDQSQQEIMSKNQLIPRPPGERGKDGWNLQANMGLTTRYDLYTNIRRAVRYAIAESQLNIWRKINQQDERALFTCYTVKEKFPYMARFEGNWATREFIKGICQNARRHCRKKGISDPTLPRELLEGEDGDDDDGGVGTQAVNPNGDDDGNGDEDNGNGNDDGDNAGKEDENHAPKRAPAKAKSSTTKGKAKAKAPVSAKPKKKNGADVQPVVPESGSNNVDEGREHEAVEEVEEVEEVDVAEEVEEVDAAEEVEAVEEFDEVEVVDEVEDVEAVDEEVEENEAVEENEDVEDVKEDEEDEENEEDEEGEEDEEDEEEAVGEEGEEDEHHGEVEELE